MSVAMVGLVCHWRSVAAVAVDMLLMLETKRKKERARACKKNDRWKKMPDVYLEKFKWKCLVFVLAKGGLT